MIGSLGNGGGTETVIVDWQKRGVKDESNLSA